MARGPFLAPEISDYILSTSLREPPILRRLREETAGHPKANFQIPPEHGQFMALLIQLMSARKTIEAIAIAPASPAIARSRWHWLCPRREESWPAMSARSFTSIARRYWKEAGVDHLIDLHLRPAMETLTDLLSQGQGGTFDFVFIDADKTSYEGYYECALKLLRSGGLIMVDNVLWSGRVLDASDGTADTEALRVFNKKLHTDSRVSLSLLPLGDGVTLALKR